MKIISIKFQQYFQNINCVGKIMFKQHENDFTKYRLELWTQFRTDGPLKLLSSHSQSGGERSVATMLYLLCLQNVTECPFRVVDEINQGMDPQNERMIFNQIVKSSEASRLGSDSTTSSTSEATEANDLNDLPCQYFLLTPKLLPNLKYTKSVTILSIYNGPWISYHGKWNLNKFINNIAKRRKMLQQNQNEE